MSFWVGRRCGLDPVLLWLWRRLAATALNQPLARKLPYTAGVALKRKKKERKKERLIQCGFGIKEFLSNMTYLPYSHSSFYPQIQHRKLVDVRPLISHLSGVWTNTKLLPQLHSHYFRSLDSKGSGGSLSYLVV